MKDIKIIIRCSLCQKILTKKDFTTHYNQCKQKFDSDYLYMNGHYTLNQIIVLLKKHFNTDEEKEFLSSSFKI